MTAYGRSVPELLAPAGGMDALLAALAAGADAVYTGLGSFNARAASGGLALGELRAACALAHRRGARVYVALNVYVRDGELAAARDLGLSALDAGADALIVADAGLARSLRAVEPSAPLHLSTQAGVQDAAAALLAARELEVERVTCARELSLPELAELCGAGVPVEAFCHGAICVCYSGACSYSARMRGRSANRGDCTQPCRMAYGLVDAAGRDLVAVKGDRLLCPRDYLSIRHVGELARAGVAALKVEGRMKNPDYAYNVVRCYREALDAASSGRELDGCEADGLEARLARSFNRGLTDVYLQGRSGAELMSFDRAINQGLEVGRVVERRYREVAVALDRSVGAGDTLEIRSTPGADAPADVPERWPMVPCPRDAAAGDLLDVRCKRRVEVGSGVHVVRSERLLRESVAAVAAMRVELEAAEALGAASEGPARPLSRTAADKVCHSNHGTPFFRPDLVGMAHFPDAVDSEAGEPDRAGLSILVAVDSPEAAAGLLRAAPVHDGAETDSSRLAEGLGVNLPPIEVAVHAYRLLEDDAPCWDTLLPRMTVILDEVNRAADAARARGLCRRAAAVICRNLGQIDMARAAGVPWDAAAPISVWNAETACWLRGLGARRIWLPGELSVEDARGIAAAAAGRVRLGVAAGGPVQLMVTEHCLLTAEGLCGTDAASASGRCPGSAAERAVPPNPCASCPRRRESRMGNRFLAERERSASGGRLPVRVDALGRTRIYAPAPFPPAPGLGDLRASGISSFFLDATGLTADEAPAALVRFLAEVGAAG